MIAPLRRLHRGMSTVLFVAVPVLLVFSLRVRPPRYYMQSPPAELTEESFEGGQVFDVFPDLGVLVRGIPAADGALVELEPAGPLARPDVLVYWSPTASEGSGLAPGALLLGTIGDRPRSYFLPPEAALVDGHLVLYSLAHQEVVGSGSLPALAEPLPELAGSTEAAP